MTDVDREQQVSLRSGLVIAGENVIFMKELHQISTYIELLEGRPTKALNDEIVAEAPVRAAEMFRGAAAPAVVLSPERVVSEAHRERLPSVTCYGAFWSIALGEGTRSVLTIVWFQDDFGTPPASVLRTIRAVEWAELAVDIVD